MLTPADQAFLQSALDRLKPHVYQLRNLLRNPKWDDDAWISGVMIEWRTIVLLQREYKASRGMAQDG